MTDTTRAAADSTNEHSSYGKDFDEAIAESPHGPEDVHFPRIGDSHNKSRNVLIDFLMPPTNSVGAEYTDAEAPWRRIASFPPLWAGIFLAVLLAALTMGVLPNTLLGGYALLILVGAFLMWFGNLIPYVREMGAPTIFCTFIPAALVYLGLFPQQGVDVGQAFLDEMGFLDFFVAAVLVGSVLALPRQLILQAGPRFMVPLFGSLVATFGVMYLVGAVTGFGGLKAVLYVAAPVMAGGIGIGAVPMAEMYAEKLGGSPDDFMGNLMSAVVLANVCCILVAGLYNALGKLRKQPFTGFNGYGQLLRGEKNKDLTFPKRKKDANLVALGQGLTITCIFYVSGLILNDLMPFFHEYAWVILLALVFNVFNLFPESLVTAGQAWSDYVQSYLVPALIVGVSLTYIDIGDVIASLKNPSFIPLIILTVVIAALSSGLLGWLAGMNFIEASITPGLVLADTGGSGDVSVLTAANRLHLMAFAALSTRFGGMINLFAASLLVGFLH